MLAIVMELLAFMPQAIKLGVDTTVIVERALALYNAPTPATPEELAELKAAIDAEKVRLEGLTAALDADQQT